MSIYKAIAAVMGELALTGISKARKNVQQGFSFRGIDDVYNSLSPLLAKHGVVILPRVISREVVERTTQKGGALFYTTLKVEFDFVAAEDGSCHCVTVYGEAMDSGDKSTNKAMSAALKYACLQTFMIPTEGESPDADAVTHEVLALEAAERVQAALESALKAGGRDAALKAWSALSAADRKAFGDERLQAFRDRLPPVETVKAGVRQVAA